MLKFSGGSAYTLSPHITVAKLLSVSSWLAGGLQTDSWEMQCLVNLTQPPKYCSLVTGDRFEQIIVYFRVTETSLHFWLGWELLLDCGKTQRNLRGLQPGESGLNEQQQSNSARNSPKREILLPPVPPQCPRLFLPDIFMSR